jgi:hypothetical protein
MQVSGQVAVRHQKNNRGALYSSRKLSEVNCHVKASCPSRYGVPNQRAREMAPLALTALGVDDILNYREIVTLAKSWELTYETGLSRP